MCLAECCVSDDERMLGASADNVDFGIRDDAVLFGESQSRIVLSCPPENVKEIKKIAADHNAPFRIIGRVGGDRLRIKKTKEYVIDAGVKEMRDIRADSLSNIML